jgi:DNA-binding transcriptional MerR regulator
MLLKVGELAKRSGLTVRTLHHYDAIGLLTPSARAEKGYRLYDRDDIARLHQIQALRRFGLALAEIQTCLTQPETPLVSIVARQIAMLDSQIAQAKRLRERLVDLHGVLLAKLNLMHDNEPSMQTHIGISTQLRDYVLRAFSETKLLIYEKYLSPEEIRFMRANYGKHAMKWPQLMADVRDAIDADVGPQTSRARELALRWLELFRSYAGDDPRTQAKFRHALQTEPELMAGTWTDATLLAFIREAMANVAQPV